MKNVFYILALTFWQLSFSQDLVCDRMIKQSKWNLEFCHSKGMLFDSTLPGFIQIVKRGDENDRIVPNQKLELRARHYNNESLKKLWDEEYKFIKLFKTETVKDTSFVLGEKKCYLKKIKLHKFDAIDGEVTVSLGIVAYKSQYYVYKNEGIDAVSKKNKNYIQPVDSFDFVLEMIKRSSFTGKTNFPNDTEKKRQFLKNIELIIRGGEGL